MLRIIGTVSSLTLLALDAQCLFAQNRSSGSDPQPTRGVVHMIVSPISTPQSVNDLVRESEVVVEGVVEAKGPSWRRNSDESDSLETDLVISVERILKGRPPRKITVSELGGLAGALAVVPTNNRFMAVKERYILFLMRDARANLPAPAQNASQRYVVTGISSGKFRIIDGTVRPSEFSAPGVKLHENEAIDSFLRRLEQLAKVK